MLTDAEVVLLSLLAEAPRHGYDLDKLIAARGYREWTSLAFSSIYYVLKRLEERGLIAAASSEGRRTVFALTEAGRGQLRDAAAQRIEQPDRPSASILPALGAYASLEDAGLQAQLRQRGEVLAGQIAWLREAGETAPHPIARAIFDFELARHNAELDWVRSLTVPSDEALPPDETLHHRTDTGLSMKIDLKKDRKDLYQPGSEDFTEVDVPELTYLAIDGHGDPNTSNEYAQAVESLYAAAYATRAAFKTDTGADFVVGPLEGLWSSDDPKTFVSRTKGEWDWTMLIPLPEQVTSEQVDRGLPAATKKKPELPVDKVYRLTFTEGVCLQIMHLGSYDDEAPTLARLHRQVMPDRGFTWNGRHHEIYLSDPRRTASEKLKTVLRQPVRTL